MPIYEYECDSCKSQYELIEKITSSANTTCENCGKNSARRLVSAPLFKLKGAGWYETDFKNKKPHDIKTANKPDTADTKESKSDSGANKTEAKTVSSDKPKTNDTISSK